MLPLNMQLAGLGDGGPSDFPVIPTDAYGNPLRIVNTDQEAGGSGSPIYMDDAGNIYEPLRQPDQEAGGGAQDNYRDLIRSTPAFRDQGYAVQPYFKPGDLDTVADIVAAPVMVAPVANAGSMPTINIPQSVASPDRPGGPNSTIQTPLPPAQTNNWWLTTTNTVGPGYVAPADPGPAPLFSIGPSRAPVAAQPVTQQPAALPPANVQTLPVSQSVAPGTNSGGYAPAWIGSGGGGGVFIPDSGGGAGGAGAAPESKSTNGLLLGALALLFALSQ